MARTRHVFPVFSVAPNISRRYRKLLRRDAARPSIRDLTGSALNEIKNALRFQSVGEIRLGLSASNDGINKVGDGVNERMFVADNVARRPPVFDVGMARFRDDDVAKSPRVLGILGIIESQPIHL